MSDLIKPPKDGIYENEIPDADYHRMDCCSRGIVNSIANGMPPAAVRYSMAHPQKTTPQMEFGSALHTFVLEPSKFNPRFCAKDIDLRKKQDVEFCEQLKIGKRLSQTSSGLSLAYLKGFEGNPNTAVSYDVELMIDEMSKAIDIHPVADPLLNGDGGFTEAALIWTDAETGMKCRCKIDKYLPDHKGGTVIDLKTTANASSEEFLRSCWNYGYYDQAAFYGLGMKAHNLPLKHWIIVAIEKSAPYLVAVYRLNTEHIDINLEHRIWPAMKMLSDCYKSGEWPGYPEEALELSFEPWMINKMLPLYRREYVQSVNKDRKNRCRNADFGSEQAAPRDDAAETLEA